MTIGLNRSPTLAEIGAHLGVEEEQVAEAMEVIDTLRQLSLDQPVNEEARPASARCCRRRPATSSWRTGWPRRSASRLP